MSAVLLAVMSLGFAPVPFPKPPKPVLVPLDQEALQGEWLEEGGSQVVYLFAGTKVTVTQIGRHCSGWIMTLDPKRMPKSMHLDGDRTTTTGTIPYLYSLEGGKLTLMLKGSNRVFQRKPR